MSAPHADRGAFVLSVDLPPIRSIGPTSGLVDLLKVVVGFGVAATWYAPDPSTSADVERILAVMPAQEIGISGDATWATTGVGRTLFLNELSRRVTRSAAAGYAITSLAVPERAVPDHLDLAVKHGIQCVRISQAQVTSSLLTRSLTRLLRGEPASGDAPRIGRYGLWQTPVSLRFPQRDRLSISGVSRQATRGLEQAADRGYFHLVIDLAAAGDARGSLAKTVEKILTVAHQDSARVAILSVRQLLHRLTAQHRGVPAQSFLRRRAA